MEDLPTHTFLKERNIPFRTATFPESTPKGTQPIAKVMGIRPEIVVKTLVFRRADGRLYVCLTGGDTKIYYEKLRKASGESDIRMAGAGEIIDTTGYAIGAIPPFGLKTKLTTYIDAKLEREPELYVGAGKFGNEIIMTPADLKKASEGTFVELVE